MLLDGEDIGDAGLSFEDEAIIVFAARGYLDEFIGEGDFLAGQIEHKIAGDVALQDEGTGLLGVILRRNGLSDRL